MWVYAHTDTAYDDEGAAHHTYTVGVFAPDGKWHTDDDFASKKEAAERVHYLNGGEPARG